MLTYYKFYSEKYSELLYLNLIFVIFKKKTQEFKEQTFISQIVINIWLTYTYIENQK